MTATRPSLPAAAAALLLLLLPSCGVLKPREDPTEHFVLRATAADGPARSAHSDLVLSVGPALVPGYLDRVQIVTGVPGNRLAVDEYEIWAEPLDRAICRVVSDNLSRRLGSSRVFPFPDVDLTRYDYRVAFWIRRFERDASGEVVLECSWGITGMPGSDAARVSESSSITVAAPADPADFSGLAEAMSAALGQLSEEVGRALVKLPTPEGG